MIEVSLWIPLEGVLEIISQGLVWSDQFRFSTSTV